MPSNTRSKLAGGAPLETQDITLTARGIRGPWAMRALVAVLVLAAGFGLKSTRVLASAGPIPAYAKQVAGGRLSNGSWGIWIFGHRSGARCWGTKVIERSLVRESVYCGLDVPRMAWQLAARGVIGAGLHRRYILFFFTRPSVERLIVLVRRGPGEGRAWLRVRAHRLTAVQSRGARVRRTFGYAVATVRGSLGRIGRVIVWDRRRHDHRRPVGGHRVAASCLDTCG